MMTVASATAQRTVYQGQVTPLTIVPHPGDTYTWELYTDSTVNFAVAEGDVTPDMAYFVNGKNTGPTVEVAWLQPGTYFYKVTAVNVIECTNHLKVGMIVILEDEDQDESILPIAVNDTFDVDCDPLYATITANDVWDDQYNIFVNLLEWPTMGTLEIDELGAIEYTVWFGVFGTDSFKYELCLDLDPPLCDTATVYLNIPDDLICDNPPPLPVDTTCHFFIPEGFSPNGDGAHDYFVVDCIEHYPDAKMMIFDKQGYLLYQHKNYGNREVWGDNDADLWWGGQTTKHHQNSDHIVIPGVYLYILDKGNGDLERGFVMVAYGTGEMGN